MSMLGLRDLVLLTPSPSLHRHHHHHQHHHHNQGGQPMSADQGGSNSLNVGFGIFPLITATPCMPQPQNNNLNNEVQVCANNNNNYLNLKMCPEVMMNIPAKKGVISVDDNSHNKAVIMESDENGIYGSESDFRVCQDCGNRAKKDCIYRRCRTCCKGRGYDCITHLKSTWVPAILRREREIAMISRDGDGGDDGGGAKRQRVFGSSQNATATSHSSNSNATTTKSLDISSYHQDSGFKQSLPGHVHAPAVFRCHRVSAIANGEDEFAYMATVHICGHVFKGFLYDHGVDGKNAMPCVSELQLGSNCSGKNRECSSAIGVPTNNTYPASAS